MAGAVTLLFLGLIYAWSIFRLPLAEMFPQWTTSQMSLTFTISMIFFCLGGFFAGLMQKRINHRLVLLLGAALIFCGFFGVSLLDAGAPSRSLMLLYALYGVAGGCGVGIGYNTVISTVNKWFADRAGLASGVMMMGFGLGGLVLGSFVDVLIGGMGLANAFRILAVIIAVVMLAASVILKVPAAKGGTASAAVSEEGSMSPSQMMKEKSFWCFVVWAVLLNSAGLLVINNAAVIAVAFGAPAVLGMVVSICNGLGRVLMGALFDRYRRRLSMLVNVCFTFTAGVLLLAGDVVSAGGVIIAGLLFTGLGYGGTPTLSSAFIHSQYGPKYFPVNFSICNFSLIPAALIGPMISSYLIDLAGGAYTWTFVMIIALALLALIFWGLVNRFSER